MNKKQILPYKELYEAYLIASQERYKYKEILDKIKEYIETHKASLPMGRDEFTCEMRYSDPVVLANDINKILEEIE